MEDFTMTREAYVSFEVAKLLHNKGFVMAIPEWNFVKGELKHHNNVDFLNNSIDDIIPDCTQQMAMRWLREAKGLVILPDYNRRLYWPKPYYFHIYTVTGDNGGRDSDKAPVDMYYKYYFHTYEEACEAAIKYCLENLI